MRIDPLPLKEIQVDPEKRGLLNGKMCLVRLTKEKYDYTEALSIFEDKVARG
jgi:hypothetical protein